MPPIYLDFNATSPLLPEALEAMRSFMTESFGNPSSAHHEGRKARQALDDARERIASLLGAYPDEVIFTSGATEANNLAVFGLLKGPGDAHALATHLEHPCVVEPLRQLESQGLDVEWLPVSPRGTLLLESVKAALQSRTKLVFAMLANHETGAIQPVKEIAALLPPGVALHCDAVQAVGKIPVNFNELRTTTLSASAHKFGGPKGIGVLIIKRGTQLAPLMFGGHQQRGLRPGTEAVPLAVGMAAALEWSVRNIVASHAKLESIRERLWMRLCEIASPVVLNGPEVGVYDVVPTTLNVSFPGCRADLLLMALDLAGVACSTGSACSSGSLLPSPVLKAMGVPDEVLRSALRFSFGPGVEESDVDAAAKLIASAVSQARAYRA
jgi:cysteine desulfurase